MKSTSFPSGLLPILFVATVSAVAAPLDPAQIETGTGLKGTLNEAEGVFKVTAPRNDVKVRVDGWQMPPFMGLTSWAAFAGTDDDALVDGDFCVLPGELQGVLQSLRKSGVNVVAIHHHMAMEEPRYIFLHYWGRGPAVTLEAKSPP